MVLYLIGLGLGSPKDITLRGLEAIKSAHFIYLETYTSLLPNCSKQDLEVFYEREIIEADREKVESGSDEMIEQAVNYEVAFLVAGDPLCATTHCDLFLRAKEKKVEVKVIHNASIMNAVASCGLSLYRFGETVSIPLFTQKWRPYSFYEKIAKNCASNLHTLLLLDIKTKEPTQQRLLSGKGDFLPPMFMTVDVAAEQLLEAEKKVREGEGGDGWCVLDSKCISLARVGAQDQSIVAGTLGDLVKNEDIVSKLGGPLHSLVLCAKELHPIEEEMFKVYSIS